MTDDNARQLAYDAVADAMKDLDPQDRLAVLTASAGAVIWACYGEHERPKLLRQHDNALREIVRKMDKLNDYIGKTTQSDGG